MFQVDGFATSARWPSLRGVKVVGFDHVVLNTLNADAMLAFYCDELGLEAVRVDEWRRGEAFFPSIRVSPETLIDTRSGTSGCWLCDRCSAASEISM